MTTLALLIFVAVASSCLTAILRRPSDTEYIELVAKYADAASSLTSMRAKIDDLQEKLDFSDDVRNMLGIENAKLAERIAELERDAKRSDEVRFWLMDQLNMVINEKWRLENALKTTQRSLRIARHKEWKRWKKVSKRRLSEYRNPTPATYHYAIGTARRSFMHNRKDWSAKERIRGYIDEIRSMNPYPLP